MFDRLRERWFGADHEGATEELTIGTDLSRVGEGVLLRDPDEGSTEWWDAWETDRRAEAAAVEARGRVEINAMFAELVETFPELREAIAAVDAKAVEESAWAEHDGREAVTCPLPAVRSRRATPAQARRARKRANRRLVHA